MTVKQILPFGDPLLRKKAKPVAELNERTLKLLDDMAETMYTAKGAGLAAPQVGAQSGQRFRHRGRFQTGGGHVLEIDGVSHLRSPSDYGSSYCSSSFFSDSVHSPHPYLAPFRAGSPEMPVCSRRRFTRPFPGTVSVRITTCL